MVEPEVSGQGADYCWRTGGCAFVGMVVGGGVGGHYSRELELRVGVGEDGVFVDVVCRLLELASLWVQGRNLAIKR